MFLYSAFANAYALLQHVTMHQHIAHPPNEQPGGVLDSISDSLLNAFAKLKKPDERFLSMRDGVHKSEEGLQNSERIWNRVRSRTNGEFFLPYSSALSSV